MGSFPKKTIIYIIILQLAVIIHGSHCPKQCVCTPVDGPSQQREKVVPFSRQLTSFFNQNVQVQNEAAVDVSCVSGTVPENIPFQTVSLTLSGLNSLDNASSQYVRLVHLKTLTIKNSTATMLHGDSLSGLGGLTRLTLSDVALGSLDSISPLAFRNLRKLVAIEFDLIPLRLLSLVKAIGSANNKTLKEVTIKCSGPNMYHAEVLDERIYRQFRHFGITNLTITSCSVALLRNGFARYLRYLKYLNVSHNFISGDKAAVLEMSFLNHLEVMDGSYQHSAFQKYPQMTWNCYAHLKRRKRRSLEIGSFLTRIPPNLQSLYLHHTMGNLNWFYKNRPLYVNPKSNLRHIDLSENYLSLLRRPIIGLNALEHLNLRGVRLVHISPAVMYNFLNLKTLLLGYNSLGQTIANDRKGLIFRNNSQLVRLDLAYNSIRSIPDGFIHSVRSVISLNLSHNQLRKIDISHLRRVKHLDLSHNNIHSFTTEFMEHLENVARTSNVTLDISSNPLSMTHSCCDVISVIEWSSTSKVNFDNYDSYRCIEGDMVTAYRYISIQKLQKDCFRSPNRIIIHLLSGISCLVLLSITTSVLVYRKRWCIRSYVYAGRRYLKLIHQQSEDFHYDAFVSYHESETQWVVRSLRQKLEDESGLRLCLHQRDFIPGEPIEDNISRGIENSRRVILVISKAFVESHWCIMEMRLARQAAIESGRDVVIPLIVQNIDYYKAGRTLLNTLRERTYIKWPHDDPQGQELFWKRVVDTLRQTTPHLHDQV